MNQTCRCTDTRPDPDCANGIAAWAASEGAHVRNLAKGIKAQADHAYFDMHLQTPRPHICAICRDDAQARIQNREEGQR